MISDHFIASALTLNSLTARLWIFELVSRESYIFESELGYKLMDRELLQDKGELIVKSEFEILEKK